jgi:hypothetical protein
MRFVSSNSHMNYKQISWILAKGILDFESVSKFQGCVPVNYPESKSTVPAE